MVKMKCIMFIGLIMYLFLFGFLFVVLISRLVWWFSRVFQVLDNVLLISCIWVCLVIVVNVCMFLVSSVGGNIVFIVMVSLVFQLDVIWCICIFSLCVVCSRCCFFFSSVLLVVVRCVCGLIWLNSWMFRFFFSLDIVQEIVDGILCSVLLVVVNELWWLMVFRICRVLRLSLSI